MSKVKKRLWMGTSVVVALMIAVGTAYAVVTHSDGVRIWTKGIGLGTTSGNTPTASSQTIEWVEEQFIEGKVVGTSPNETVCLEIGAPVGTSDGGQVRIFVNDGSDGAAAVASEDQAFLHAYSNSGWTPHAKVGADWDGNAWIESVDGGSSVEATDDGDVIITLGS